MHVLFLADRACALQAGTRCLSQSPFAAPCGQLGTAVRSCEKCPGGKGPALLPTGQDTDGTATAPATVWADHSVTQQLLRLHFMPGTVRIAWGVSSWPETHARVEQWQGEPGSLNPGTHLTLGWLPLDIAIEERNISSPCFSRSVFLLLGDKSIKFVKTLIQALDWGPQYIF